MNRDATYQLNYAYALDLNLTSKKCYSATKQMNSITDKLARELTTPP